MSKLSKSFTDLDEMADELLAKSEESTPVDEPKEDLEKSAGASEEEKDLSPDEVSENVPEEEVENTDETSEKDAEKGEEPKEDKVEKSVKPEEVVENPENEEIEKSCDCNKDGSEIKKSDENGDTEGKTVAEPDTLEKSIMSPEFISAVADALVKSMANVLQPQDNSDESNDVLAKSLQASLIVNKSMSEELATVKEQNATLEKSIQDGFDSLQDFIGGKIDEMSHQPATMRKSVGNMSVHERDFQKSLTGKDSGVEMLSKSEVMAKLSNYMYSGNPLVTPTDIISYESGAPLRPEVAALIQSNM